MYTSPFFNIINKKKQIYLPNRTNDYISFIPPKKKKEILQNTITISTINNNNVYA